MTSYIVKYDTRSDSKPLMHFKGFKSFTNRMFLLGFEEFGPAHSCDNGYRKRVGEVVVSFEDRRLWTNLGYKITPFIAYSFMVIDYHRSTWNEGFEFDDPDRLTESDIDNLLLPK